MQAGFYDHAIVLRWEMIDQCAHVSRWEHPRMLRFPGIIILYATPHEICARSGAMFYLHSYLLNNNIMVVSHKNYCLI